MLRRQYPAVRPGRALTPVCRAGPKDFSDLKTTRAATASPILVDCLAFLDCKVVEILPGGDHEIFVGEILAGEHHGGEPLLYYAGGYRRLAEP